MGNHKYEQLYLAVCCQTYQNGEVVRKEKKRKEVECKIERYLSVLKMRGITICLYSVENNLIERVTFLMCFQSSVLEEVREDGHGTQGEELALDRNMKNVFLICLN